MMNKILFPAPKPAHYTLTSHESYLFWLPDYSAKVSPVPCMFYSPLSSPDTAKLFIIFSHGNGCDIGTMHYLLRELAQRVHAHILIFEYPSYGLCTAPSPNQTTINGHAERAYSFVRNTLNWPSERIVLFGHSIGSGAACHIASTEHIGALILQSPYTSISNLVREKVGILSLLVGTRSWDNLEAMKNITCPVLFMHGQRDNLIPSNHSERLYDACTVDEYNKQIVLLPHDDHNSISDQVVISHVKRFLAKNFQSAIEILLPKVRIDNQWRISPQETTSSTERERRSSGVFDSLRGFSRASTSATMSSLRSLSGRSNEESDENKQ